jgi:hypothetical protein
MSQAPAPMVNMMQQVDTLRGFDLKPLESMLKEMGDKVGNINVDAVKEPVNKFAGMAGEQVDALDKLVQGAKMAGGLGEVSGMVPKPGMFC